MNLDIEKVDIFDDNMNKISPFVVSKREAHIKGLWHKTIHCWIVRKEGKILFQLRSPKTVHGDLFDITVAGHIMTGEEHALGVRELKEELGLDVSMDNLTFVGVYKHSSYRQEDEYNNREFSYTYFYRCDKMLDDYTLQTEEVKGLYEMDIKEGMKFFSGEIETIEMDGFVLTSTGLVKDKKIIDLTNICSYNERCILSRYYLRALITAERFLNGNRYLAI